MKLVSRHYTGECSRPSARSHAHLIVRDDLAGVEVDHLASVVLGERARAALDDKGRTEKLYHSVANGRRDSLQ